MRILPCANEVATWAGAGRQDVFVCSCVTGAWTCADCFMGSSPCGPIPEAAAPDVTSSDAGEDAPDDAGSGGASDGPSPEAGLAQCQVPAGDASTVYAAGIGITGDDAGSGAPVIVWVDDGGTSESCGSTACSAICPTGQSCSVSFPAHAVTITGGTCL
jgi:hypothetical protein